MFTIRFSLLVHRQIINSKLLQIKKSNRVLSVLKSTDENSTNKNKFQSTEPAQKSKEFHKNVETNNRIHTIPNYITISRIMSVPFINYCVLIDKHELACGLFFLASLTDFIDGYIARNWPNQQSFLGSILDPLADKLLIGSLTVTLAINNMLPIELVCIILARDIGLILASLILRYKLIDEPKTFKKYLNVKKYSTVQIEADLISKINTFLQLSLITLTLPSVLFNYNESIILLILQYLTGTTTILSSISYLYKRGSFKLINK